MQIPATIWIGMQRLRKTAILPGDCPPTIDECQASPAAGGLRLNIFLKAFLIL